MRHIVVDVGQLSDIDFRLPAGFTTRSTTGWLLGWTLKALAVFACGLSVGIFLGWIQQMRGAHFLTHTLWSAWITAALILLLLRLCGRGIEAQHDVAG